MDFMGRVLTFFKNMVYLKEKKMGVELWKR
jgi:hypothetical protein